MISRDEYKQAVSEASRLLVRSGLTVSDEELARMEVADFGLSEWRQSGLQIVTLVDTDQIAAKLLILLPKQTMPEHMHPRIDDYKGKQETIRCEWGELYVYGPGEPAASPLGHPPQHRLHTYTVWHEYALRPGEQVTFPPQTPHWFQGGSQGAVAWSLSTKATDIADIFTDPDVVRQTVLADG